MENQEMLKMILQAINESNEKTEKRFDSLEQRVVKLEEKVDRLAEDVRTLKADVEDIKLSHQYVKNKIFEHDEAVSVLKQRTALFQELLESLSS